jgi:nucleoside phosphorylase
MGQAKPLGRGREYHAISLENRITFYLATYGKNKVAIVRTDQGARRTRRVLRPVQEKLQAQYVIAVGICYGLRERNVKLGDVIVSKRIVDHSKKRAKKVDIIFHQSQNTAGTLYNLFKMSGGFALPKSSDDYVNVKTGDIVSETTLVADQKHKDHRILKQIPHALGGEMEGAGIMKLAGANHFEWIVIKAVADWGDGNKETCKKWQPFAAVAAAKYVWFHLDRKDLKQEKELMQSNGQQHIPEQEKNLRERKVPHSSPTADDNINKSEPPNVSPTSGTCSNFKLIFSCLIISCLIMGVCILVYTYKESEYWV